MSVTFDASINLGNVITIGLGVVTLAVAWTKLGGRLDMLEYRVKAIEHTLELIAHTMTQLGATEKTLALIDQRLAAAETLSATLHETVERLRRGQGWDSGPGRNSVDGEYPARRGL